jgi:hypothetical protein
VRTHSHAFVSWSTAVGTATPANMVIHVKGSMKRSKQAVQLLLQYIVRSCSTSRLLHACSSHIAFQAACLFAVEHVPRSHQLLETPRMQKVKDLIAKAKGDDGRSSSSVRRDDATSITSATSVSTSDRNLGARSAGSIPEILASAAPIGGECSQVAQRSLF